MAGCFFAIAYVRTYLFQDFLWNILINSATYFGFCLDDFYLAAFGGFPGLRPRGAVFGPPGPPQTDPGRYGTPGVLGVSWPILDASWAVLEQSWRLPGLSWADGSPEM